MICEKCGGEFFEDYRKDKGARKTPIRFCSRSCANSKTFSEETNQRRSISNKKAAASPDWQGKRASYRRECFVCGKIFIRKTGSTAKTCSLECKKTLQSEIRSLFIETKGGGGFLDVPWFQVQNILGESYNVRGTWELKYAEYLNKERILWNRNISFKYYTEDGVRRTYIPDFFLPYLGKFKEIKGYFSEKDKEKISLVESQNQVKIDLLFRKDLEDLGIQLH